MSATQSPVRLVDGKLTIVAITPDVKRLARAARAIAEARARKENAA